MLFRCSVVRNSAKLNRDNNKLCETGCKCVLRKYFLPHSCVCVAALSLTPKLHRNDTAHGLATLY
jgi:hypothetical protein